MEAGLACGEFAQAIGMLTSLIAANPLRENPRRLLMLALYRTGRHAEALAVYRDACAALDEIGLQPGPELRALEEAILRHGSRLAGAPMADDTTIGEPALKPAVEERGTATQTSPAGPVSAKRQSRRVVTALHERDRSSSASSQTSSARACHLPE